ncbi:hypothetical protein A5634_07080 [Mycobacterium asiaticum]|uniref:ANTAR domain-containing protein n=1 Tax=Mycobacterium asiaticum TaxID=1790 RepID=A0A1A3NKR0_MYCAS|nr:ANTAR domain-containing protein [Mycobacterium asiaticum]OBK22728.1 hypothetical protein A5634_07080 [Mycobacterium asiaticum]
MSEKLETQQQFSSPGRAEATRFIDTAVGILVGWRRCSTQTAFRELLAASERHRVPLFAMAGALVSLASEHADAPAVGAAAEESARREWAEELRSITDAEGQRIDREP